MTYGTILLVCYLNLFRRASVLSSRYAIVKRKVSKKVRNRSEMNVDVQWRLQEFPNGGGAQLGQGQQT